MDAAWECIVVGGGAAGLSAALMLGRARRRTLIVDAGQQSNLAAERMGGVLGHDRRPPAALYAAGRDELKEYPTVELRSGEVVGGRHDGDLFELELDDGARERTQRVLLATGMHYQPPDLPGLAELWGRTVFQCPFCHGWEMRDRRLAVLAAGEAGIKSALLLRGWSDDVVLLTDGPSNLTAAECDRLAAADVMTDDRRIVELLSADGELTAIAFADGTRLDRDGLLVEAPLAQRSELAGQLGAVCTAGPLGADTIGIDELHRTSSAKVFAAGDVCTESPDVAEAIASGHRAAKMVVQSLLADRFGLPYPPTDN